MKQRGAKDGAAGVGERGEGGGGGGKSYGVSTVRSGEFVLFSFYGFVGGERDWMELG